MECFFSKGEKITNNVVVGGITIHKYVYMLITRVDMTHRYTCMHHMAHHRYKYISCLGNENSKEIINDPPSKMSSLYHPNT